MNKETRPTMQQPRQKRIVKDTVTDPAKKNERVRLNKRIADSGLCSRRKADELIQNGVVCVNGRVVVQPGTQVHPINDTIVVDGQTLPKYQKSVYLLFHKPSGIMTTRSDEKGRKTIYAYLPPPLQSVDPAGRLDRESSGALILSNDGNFIYRVTHPKFHLPKVYRVVIDKPLQEADIRRLKAGVLLMPENKPAQVTALELEKPNQMIITLVTGYNRQLRRTFELLGYAVIKLKRIRIGPIPLGDVKPGAFRHLNRKEIEALISPTESRGKGTPK